MSSCFAKSLRCFNCSKYYLIEDVEFPENVFEIIRENNLDENLFWMCDLCKPSSTEKSYVLDKNESPAGRWSKYPSGRLMRDIDVFTPSRKHPKQSNSVLELIKSAIPSHEKATSRFSSSRSPSPPDTDRRGRKYAQQILKKAAIPRDKKSKNKLLVNEILDFLINNMKKNEEFKGMINRLYPTGSAYNDLKVTSATEYDFNLILKVPKWVKLIPEFFDENHAFVKLKWESNTEVIDSSIKFFKENSDKNYLNPIKVLSWLQRHIDLTLKQDLQFPNEVLEVRNSASGPARTIIISSKCGIDINIDLVPVFEFEYALLASTCFYDKIIEFVHEKNENNSFFVVPKHCTEETNISVSDSKFCWRLDFPNAEKYILSEKECAKSVIKILKCFRDKKDWKGIASYYLKMIVILEILKNSSKEHWKNGNIHLRMIDSLKQLAEYLKSGCLPHFLTQHNLFEKLNESNRISWSNHLNHVIDSWESDPANIVSFFED